MCAHRKQIILRRFPAAGNSEDGKRHFVWIIKIDVNLKKRQDIPWVFAFVPLASEECYHREHPADVCFYFGVSPTFYMGRWVESSG